VIDRDGPAALGYGITEGDPQLRSLIVDEMRSRGVACADENVIVTAGALQAIDLAVRALVEPGDVVVVESPHFTNAISCFRNRGATVLEIHADDHGMDVAYAARQIRESGVRPSLFFVVPNFQNPTGATLARDRRAGLVALAASYGAKIIEDDPYRQLRYRGDDIEPIASFADGEDVVYCGSFSKVFLPGLRVGWAVANAPLVREMAAAKQTIDSSTSSLSQRIIVEFHHRDRMGAHVAALKAMYAEKQSRARAALAREFAGTGVRWNDPDGGFYLWVTLPHRVSSSALFDAALQEGVAFVPGYAFGVDHEHDSALRFSYSSPTPDRIDEGVRRLRRAFDRVA
jgi:2-aminoadipate transaminase